MGRSTDAFLQDVDTGRPLCLRVGTQCLFKKNKGTAYPFLAGGCYRFAGGLLEYLTLDQERGKGGEQEKCFVFAEFLKE